MKRGALGENHDVEEDAERINLVGYYAAIHHPGMSYEPAVREAAGPYTPCVWHGYLASCHSGIQLAPQQKW